MAFKAMFAWLADASGLRERRCRNCLEPFMPTSLQPDLCPDCAKLFAPYQGPACPLCGEPFMDELCPACLAGRPWKRIAFHGLYSGELRDMIRRLKYDGELALAPFLGRLLLEASRRLPKPDAIVPLPQFPPRLARRGFNQTHEIGRHLARLGGFPLQDSWLERIRHDQSQASLDRCARASNVQGDFRGASAARGKRIWLLDDVMTTGGTLKAAAQSLLDAGCVEVSLLVVARTPLHEPTFQERAGSGIAALSS